MPNGRRWSGLEVATHLWASSLNQCIHRKLKRFSSAKEENQFHTQQVSASRNIQPGPSAHLLD